MSIRLFLPVILVAASGCSSTGTSVAPEPEGPNCAHGGVRITDSDGKVEYACNGAPGENARIEAEPAGANCAAGGLRITAADGAVSYVCAQEEAAAIAQSLCPGATYPNAVGGAGMFMQIGGAFPIPGEATAPAVSGHSAINDAIRLEAICHGFEVLPPVGQTPGGTFHRPFTVVTSLDSALPLLMESIDRARPHEVQLRVYGEDSVGQDTVDARMVLTNAHLVLVEQFVAPDPREPQVHRPFVRLAFLYQSYEYATFGPSGTTVSSAQSDFVALEPEAPCAPAPANEDRISATLSLKGAVVSSSIEVLGTCLRVERPYSGALLTGAIDYGPLQIVKPVDAATPTLQQALLNNQLVELTLSFERPDPDAVGGGGFESVFEEQAQNARVTRYEQLLLNDTRLERIQLDWTYLRQTWLQTGAVFEIDLLNR